MTAANGRKSYVDHIGDLSNQALYCHTYGHAWDQGPVMNHGPVGVQAWTVKLHCVSCGMEREDILEPGTYELMRRRYERPDGYRLIEPAVRTDYREEVVRRLAGKGNGSGNGTSGSGLRRKGAPGRFGQVGSAQHPSGG